MKYNYNVELSSKIIGLNSAKERERKALEKDEAGYKVWGLPFLFGAHRDAAWPAAQLPQHNKIGLIYKADIWFILNLSVASEENHVQ